MFEFRFMLLLLPRSSSGSSPTLLRNGLALVPLAGLDEKDDDDDNDDIDDDDDDNDDEDNDKDERFTPTLSWLLFVLPMCMPLPNPSSPNDCMGSDDKMHRIK
jgi:hypothetical protein